MPRRRPTAKEKRPIPTKPQPRDGADALTCSFCGKSQHDVRKLIHGPSVCICDECVELCQDILAAPEPSEVEKEAARRSWARYGRNLRKAAIEAAKLAERKIKADSQRGKDRR